MLLIYEALSCAVLVLLAAVAAAALVLTAVSARDVVVSADEVEPSIRASDNEERFQSCVLRPLAAGDDQAEDEFLVDDERRGP